MRIFSASAGSFRSLRMLLLAVTAFALTVVASVALASPAAAHAEWLGSSPEDGATVDVLPETLTLTFSSDLLNAEGATEIVVTDEAGASVTVGAPVVAGPVVTQQLAPEASAGLYHVVWKVVYGDGHPDAKEFSFTVATSTVVVPSPEPTAEVQETESAMPDATAPPVTTEETAPVDAGTVTVWVLLVAAAIALIVLVSVITVRKRHSADGSDSTDESAR